MTADVELEAALSDSLARHAHTMGHSLPHVRDVRQRVYRRRRQRLAATGVAAVVIVAGGTGLVLSDPFADTTTRVATDPSVPVVDDTAVTTPDPTPAPTGPLGFEDLPRLVPDLTTTEQPSVVVNDVTPNVVPDGGAVQLHVSADGGRWFWASWRIDVVDGPTEAESPTIEVDINGMPAALGRDEAYPASLSLLFSPDGNDLAEIVAYGLTQDEVLAIARSMRAPDASNGLTLAAPADLPAVGSGPSALAPPVTRYLDWSDGTRTVLLSTTPGTVAGRAFELGPVSALVRTTVRGKSAYATVWSYEGAASGAGTPGDPAIPSVTLLWEERPGVVVRMTARGFDVEGAVAAADALVDVDQASWDALPDAG